MLNIIQRFTDSQGWKFGRLDGNTNVAARQHLVDNFNSDESYYGMLMTTRTGGVGLNLTGADRIILYDPDWNPQTDAQARRMYFDIRIPSTVGLMGASAVPVGSLATSRMSQRADG